MAESSVKKNWLDLTKPELVRLLGARGLQYEEGKIPSKARLIADLAVNELDIDDAAIPEVLEEWSSWSLSQLQELSRSLGLAESGTRIVIFMRMAKLLGDDAVIKDAQVSCTRARKLEKARTKKEKNTVQKDQENHAGTRDAEKAGPQNTGTKPSVQEEQRAKDASEPKDKNQNYNNDLGPAPVRVEAGIHSEIMKLQKQHQNSILSLMRQREEVERRLEISEQTSQRLKSQATTAGAEKVAALAKATDLSKELSAAKKESAGDKNNIKDLTANIERLQKTVGDQNSEIEKVRSLHASAQRQLEAAQKALSETRAAHQDTDPDAQGLSRQLDEMKSENRRLHEQLEQANRHTASPRNLTQLVEDQDTRIHLLHDEIKILERQVERASADKQSIHGTFRTLPGELNTAETDVASDSEVDMGKVQAAMKRLHSTEKSIQDEKHARTRQRKVHLDALQALNQAEEESGTPTEDTRQVVTELIRTIHGMTQSHDKSYIEMTTAHRRLELQHQREKVVASSLASFLPKDIEH